MKTQEVILQNQSGLHARPCTELVHLASKFDCTTIIRFGSKKTNVKSVLGLMTLGAKQGEKIVVLTDGAEEQEAMNDLIAYFENLKD